MMSRRSNHTRGIRRIVGAVAAATVGLGMLVAGPATADQFPVDLLDGYDARFDGAALDNQSAYSVSAAGDVNGDGFNDMLIGAPMAGTNGQYSGASYVIFGGTSISDVDLGDLDTAGFRIDGAAAGEFSGYSVSGAGDVNDDGYADLLIGAPYADRNSRTDSGSSFVVFGSATPGTVNLGSLGTGGFRIDGAAAGDWSGRSVAGAGDVNNDGYADLLIGASGAGNNARPGSGSVYVVFGEKTPATLDLNSLGTRGFRIDGAAEYHRVGQAVAGPGDVNNDGYADLLVSAPYATASGRSDAGLSYVVFGKTSTTAVDLATLDVPEGFSILGADTLHRAGSSLAGPGDVNNDGLPDLLIGAPLADAAAGSAFVVYGDATPASVDLAALGAAGRRIDGADGDDQCGYAMAGADDMDGDGVRDLLLGAAKASNNGRILSGSSYVIYGDDGDAADVDLATLGTSGFRIDGAADVDQSGSSVAGLGDVNDDGSPDLLIGAPEADNNSRSKSGSSYLILHTPAYYTIPGAPTGLGGTPGDQQVQLSWTAPNDGGAPITGYRIDTKVGDDPWTNTIPDTGSAAPTHTVTGLANGMSYQFRVAALNAAGPGPYSDPSPTLIPRTVPNAPADLTGTPGNAQVQLSWTAPDDGGAPVTGYRIEVRPSGQSWYPVLTGSTATTHAVTGLTNGTAYDFRVAAINAAGTGPASGQAGPYTPVTTPAAPTGLTGTPGDQQVQLSWTAPADSGGTPITGYQLQTKAGDGPWSSTTTGSTTTHTITGLTNGTAYQFRVAAINAVGTGPVSDPTGPLTPVAPPPPVTPPPAAQQASLAVTARSASKAVPKKGKATLVSAITTGPAQTTSITVTVKPKKAKPKITVTKTATSVKVRTRKAPKATITVSITASGTGVTPTTWQRTWKVR